ncbi:MAG TPA: NUDIX domain-containing protein [Acidimicrobiia bacterium]|nr:NUDIX domain-containing protein [Acidimicrobiia bacterium]
MNIAHDGDVLPQYCSQCASAVEVVEVGGESVWRCPVCGHRQYRRQWVGVAVVVVEDGRLLMVQRRYGDLAGAWCIPCGHVGWDEDVRAAAVRELEEETGLVVELDGVFDVHTTFVNRNRHNAGIWFLGHRVGGTLAAGDDAVDARFFPLDAIPQPLAFDTDARVIETLRDRPDRVVPGG